MILQRESVGLDGRAHSADQLIVEMPFKSPTHSPSPSNLNACVHALRVGHRMDARCEGQAAVVSVIFDTFIFEPKIIRDAVAMPPPVPFQSFGGGA